MSELRAPAPLCAERWERLRVYVTRTQPPHVGLDRDEARQAAHVAAHRHRYPRPWTLPHMAPASLHRGPAPR